MPVTRRQREILDYIGKHIAEKGYAPSFEEIARQFGFQSLATVHEHLTNLERKGYIRRTHNESRAIEIVPPKGQTGATELPLLGFVAAGAPIEAITSDETIAVPDELLPRRGRSYVLKVRGDSMIDEHIKDGDYVVVQERNQAEAGWIRGGCYDDCCVFRHGSLPFDSRVERCINRWAFPACGRARDVARQLKVGLGSSPG